MLTELTKEQEARFDEFAQKWIAIGTDLTAINHKKAEQCFADVYKTAGLPVPELIVWVESPIAALRKYAELCGIEVGEDPATFPADVKNQLSNFCYGQHDVGWLSFNDFFIEVCNLDKECPALNNLKPLIETAKTCGWWLAYDKAIIAVEKPLVLHMNANGLHMDLGPAVAYADGMKGYYLNGVRMSEHIVMTPWDKLDCSEVIKEQNAEVRREIVRKIGVERLCKELHSKVIDKQGDYELLELDLGDGRRRPWLKMLNPSIGVYHIEGVPPETKTVKDALIFRNGTEETPEKLT